MSLLFDSVSSTTTAHDSTLGERAMSPLQWELIFDGVWVARRDGRFCGMAQGAPGEPVKLTDARGNLCGHHASLDDATSALSALAE
jgi:hypothetical protein